MTATQSGGQGTALQGSDHGAGMAGPTQHGGEELSHQASHQARPAVVGEATPGRKTRLTLAHMGDEAWSEREALLAAHMPLQLILQRDAAPTAAPRDTRQVGVRPKHYDHIIFNIHIPRHRIVRVGGPPVDLQFEGQGCPRMSSMVLDGVWFR